MKKEQKDFEPMTDESESQLCPTNLLDDSPVDYDSFGGHDRIAAAIADVIKRENGGHSIALMGPWGSGKSTIVNLLKKKLEDCRDIAMFEFDAWAHEGDPLRRSFLEKIADFLISNGWVRERDCKDELDKIRKRKEDVESTTKPIVSVLGNIFAFSFLLLSILLPVLIPRNYFFSFFSFLPLTILVGAWFYWRPTWKFWQKNFWREKRPPHENDSLAAIFVNKTRNVTKTTATHTPDPTSIEFQGIFTKVVGTALKENQRRLVIVIDNLDRVSPNDALSIWSTMRTFFEFDKSEPWVKRMWLLVPLASEALKRLWREETRDENTNEKDKSPPDHSKQRSLADEFVDKTFQIVFHVPLPVMSDWKEFFKEQIEAALPKHKDDFYAVYRIFEKKRASNNRPPTPREIKLFINKLGVYHRIWQDKILPPIQAWYVLEISKKLDAESPESVLLDQANKLFTDDLRELIRSGFKKLLKVVQ